MFYSGSLITGGRHPLRTFVFSFCSPDILAGRTAEAIVGDADYGATRIASAFSLACIPFATRRVPTPPAPRRRGVFNHGEGQFEC